MFLVVRLSKLFAPLANGPGSNFGGALRFFNTYMYDVHTFWFLY